MAERCLFQKVHATLSLGGSHFQSLAYLSRAQHLETTSTTTLLSDCPKHTLCSLRGARPEACYSFNNSHLCRVAYVRGRWASCPCKCHCPREVSDMVYHIMRYDSALASDGPLQRQTRCFRCARRHGALAP